MRITELFANGEFVVTAEVGPPKGIHVDHLVEEAKTYLSGITAVNVTDNQSSVMRMGSLPACVALHNAGLTPILQLTCRDRNRIALQSELLGAAMLGIENILCLTGDHTKMGDHPGAKPVFDLDSVSLLHTVCQLEKGVDLGGQPLVGEPPKFAKGAVVSPCSDSVMHSLPRWSARLWPVRSISRLRLCLTLRSSSSSWKRQSSLANPCSLALSSPSLQVWQSL